MHKVKIVGIILLAIYLVLNGLFMLVGMSMPPVLQYLLALLSLAAGVLFLISVGHRCCCCCNSCSCGKGPCNPCDKR